METGGGQHGPADVVRGHQHVVRLGGGGELPRLQDAAEVADVRLDDVGGLRGEQLPELDAVVDAFAGRDGDVHLPGDLAQRLKILRRYGLLQPRRIVRREFARQPHRRGAEPSVHLQHQLGVGADGVPHGLDQRHRVAGAAGSSSKWPVPNGSIFRAR